MNVYYNGPIMTMEDGMPFAEILIEEQGKIFYVGDKLNAPIDVDANWMDLKGHTLMPALIDGHGHLSNTANFLKTVPLQAAESFEDISRIMKGYLTQHPNAETLIGMGYDHNFLSEGIHPDKTLLDDVSCDIPVLIVHTSMHIGVANSKLLEIAGFVPPSVEIPGGIIARNPKSGEPVGLLEEAAMFEVMPYVGDLFSPSCIADLVDAQEFYIKNGILTIQEGAAKKESVELVREMADTGQLKCDIVCYPCFKIEPDAQKIVHDNKQFVNKYVNHFKIGGYKIVLDGSPQCKTAWLSKPYQGEKEYRGYPGLEDKEVQKYVDIAVEEQMQLLTHCNGDAAGDQFLNAYEKSVARYDAEDCRQQLRPVMIHCQTVRNDQLERMRKLQMIASIFIGHVNYWGDVHVENLGEERGSHISPVKSALDREVTVNFHTDTPVTMPYMFHSVWSAVNRMTRQGKILAPDECIDVWNALKAVTINAAYSYFEENEKGTLKAGKKADFIVIDRNPMAIDKMDIKNIQVLASIKEGTVLYQKNRV